ncbi:MAG: type II toxin-antitoxin system Phd/YefM family antitoxin [Coriobacteriaceae bacterium]|nr:type II toxin-antitoxin system Phd/YefM family antitoxin [Coriobacteriaceae bacterium]
MPVCVPVRDVKDTTKFIEVLNNSDAPVTVTRNGYDAFVAMSNEVYEGIRLNAAKAKLYEHLQEAERDIESGDVMDFDAFISGLRSQNGN